MYFNVFKFVALKLIKSFIKKRDPNMLGSLFAFYQ